MFFGTAIGGLYILVAAGLIQNHNLRRDIEELYYQELLSALILDDKLKTIKENTKKEN